MIQKRIVYTRPDGGVSVCHPAAECMMWLSNGGYWAGQTRGWLERQEELQIAGGHSPSSVRRFMRAMQDGGCTTAEAYDIIRDRDCGHLGTGFELWEPHDLPDRWFRDAWVRSHNGGPIHIDLHKARRIQISKITNHGASRKLDLDMIKWRSACRRASSVEDLRRIWPRV